MKKLSKERKLEIVKEALEDSINGDLTELREHGYEYDTMSELEDILKEKSEKLQNTLEKVRIYVEQYEGHNNLKKIAKEKQQVNVDVDMSDLEEKKQREEDVIDVEKEMEDIQENTETDDEEEKIRIKREDLTRIDYENGYENTGVYEEFVTEILDYAKDNFRFPPKDVIEIIRDKFGHLYTKGTLITYTHNALKYCKEKGWLKKKEKHYYNEDAEGGLSEIDPVHHPSYIDMNGYFQKDREVLEGTYK